MVYLDNASTTKPFKEVLELYNENHFFANPSSNHTLGQEAKHEIENSRNSISEILNCKPKEIIFTSGGTESNNLSIRGIIENYNIRDIITSKLEHPSVLETIKNLKNINVYYLENDRKGILNLDSLEEILNRVEGRSLISIIHINNEIGNINDIEKIGKISKKHNAIFHTDAVQSVGIFNINLDKFNIDLLSASAHKFNGIKGNGFLFCREGIDLKSQIKGGFQENKSRAGTENTLGIIGMAKALEINYLNKDKLEYLQKLKELLIRELPFLEIIGDLKNSSPSIVNLSLPKIKSLESVLLNLDMNEIYLSNGSACKSGAEEISSVIKNIDENLYPNIRVSLSTENNKKEILEFSKKLKEILK